MCSLILFARLELAEWRQGSYTCLGSVHGMAEQDTISQRSRLYCCRDLSAAILVESKQLGLHYRFQVAADSFVMLIRLIVVNFTHRRIIQPFSTRPRTDTRTVIIVSSLNQALLLNPHPWSLTAPRSTPAGKTYQQCCSLLSAPF